MTVRRAAVAARGAGRGRRDGHRAAPQRGREGRVRGLPPDQPRHARSRPPSLVTLALLGVEDRALTLDEVARRRSTRCSTTWRAASCPTTGGRRPALRSDALRGDAGHARDATGWSPASTDGIEPVYGDRRRPPPRGRLLPQRLIHFFVNRAIAELAAGTGRRGDVGRACRRGVARGAAAARPAQVRVLLRRASASFADELREELAPARPGLGEAADRGRARPRRVLAGLPMLLAHRVLRPFLEAYHVVADRLAAPRPAPSRSTRRSSSHECIGARAPVPAPAAAAQPGVDLQGAVRRRAPAGRATATCSSPAATSVRQPRSAFAGGDRATRCGGSAPSATSR